MPDLLTKIQDEWLPWINRTLGTFFVRSVATEDAGRDNAGAVGGDCRKLAGSAAVWRTGGDRPVVNLTLVPVVMFYVLRTGRKMIAGIDRMLPIAPVRPTVRDMAREIDAVLSEFLRGQGHGDAGLATYYCVALKIAGTGVRAAGRSGDRIAGFIPYVGFGLGLMLGMLAALDQFTTPGADHCGGGGFHGWPNTGRLRAGALSGGDRIGLHPLSVIFALMAFGQLFGLSAFAGAARRRRAAGSPCASCSAGC